MSEIHIVLLKEPKGNRDEQVYIFYSQPALFGTDKQNVLVHLKTTLGTLGHIICAEGVNQMLNNLYDSEVIKTLLWGPLMCFPRGTISTDITAWYSGALFKFRPS